MIRSIQQGLAADGFKVPVTKLCRWFDVPRRRVYYKPVKSPSKVDPVFAEPIQAMIEQEPSFAYRTVAHLLGFNKNTVQRIFQIKGWKVRKRPVGARPRIEAKPSVAQAPNERWSTDLARSGKASTATSALEHALIAQFGTLGRVETPFLLRSDNGLVFTSCKYTAPVRSYGL